MEEHLQFLYTCNKEFVTKVLKWVEERNFFRIEGDIIAQNGEYIKFKGTYSPRSKNFSFILLYKRKYIIRRFDMEPRHWNPDGTLIEGEHKHKWTDEHLDTIAYKVDDIDTNDINQAIFDFFEECNIDYNGVIYQPFISI